MSISRMFGDHDEEWLALFPGRKRRWNVTIFRRELINGDITETVSEQFNGVRSRGLLGDILVQDGILHFIDDAGKEVIVSSMPFIAKEVAPADVA